MDRDHSWFERNPKKTITTIFLLFFSLADFLFSMNRLFIGHERLYRIRSSIYHHDLAPNKSIKRAQWGYRFYQMYTNSLGFRDRIVRDIDVNSENHRVLFIGDSFTEGIGVEYEKTFIGIIDNELRAEGIEVLNASASSYSPIIYLRKIQYLIDDVRLKFDDVVVFLDISDIQDEAVYYMFDKEYNVIDNDIMIKSESERGNNNCSHIGEENVLDNYLRKIKKFTILTRLIIISIQNITNPDPFFRKDNCSTNLRRGMWTIDNNLYEEYGKIGLEKSKENLDRILHILKNHSIKLTIAVYPWPDQIISHDVNSRQVTFWKKWAIENKVTFLNFFPHFMNHENTKEILKAYFIPGDTHYNENGHQLIAHVFLDSSIEMQSWMSHQSRRRGP